MHLAHKNLYGVFATCAFFLLLSPSVWPSLKLFFWAPFLIILIYQKPFFSCLWGAFGCGLLLDLLSARTLFGMHACNYVLTTALLYERRQNFFGDSTSTLPLMVFFFSLLSTILGALFLYIVEKGFTLSWRWVFIDLVGMPLLDATYAFVVFILPFMLLGRRPRKGREYFSN
jgi:rod shape-determining protein MreD